MHSILTCCMQVSTSDSAVLPGGAILAFERGLCSLHSQAIFTAPGGKLKFGHLLQVLNFFVGHLLSML